MHESEVTHNSMWRTLRSRWATSRGSDIHECADTMGNDSPLQLAHTGPEPAGTHPTAPHAYAPVASAMT